MELLEQQRSALRAEVEPLGEPDADDAVPVAEQLRRVLQRFGWSRYVRIP